MASPTARPAQVPALKAALALGTYAGGWAVSEVKVKRLYAGK